MASVFSTFNAYPVTAGNALHAQWTYTSSFINSLGAGGNTPQFLYLLVTDYNAVGFGKTLSSVIVIPLRDPSTNALTTSYNINSNTDGITFPIQNGTPYHLMAQMIYLDSSAVIQTVNSNQSIVMCSTIPSVPNFSLTPTTNAFQIQLLTDANTIPTPVSAFDGYSVLKGIFVNYASKTQLYSKFIANDASNTLYNTPQQIDASLNEYEVSIASYNYDTSNNWSWGGRSATSDSDLVDVDDTPGPVQNLTVFETMRDVSAILQPTFTTVSNTITWDLPSVNIGASNETITGYQIYRNGVFLADVAGRNNRSYTDAASLSNVLVAGQIYNYQVAAVNSFGPGPTSAGVNITAVVFPTISGFTVDPSGSQSLSMRVSNVSPNGFLLANYRFDFSYNRVGVPNSQVSINDTSANPYLATGLVNGAQYRAQANASVPSNTNPAVVYTTAFTAPVSATPYNPELGPATDISLNPLDASGIPSGQIIVSWKNPANSGLIGGQMTYELYRAAIPPPTVYPPPPPPEASFNLINTDIVTPGSRTNFTDTNVVLGQVYVYQIVNKVTTTATPPQVAVSPDVIAGPIIPFLPPPPVTNLTLYNPTTTDLLFSFTPPPPPTPTNPTTGGFPLAGFQFTVINLSDNSSNIIYGPALEPLTDVSGSLSAIISPATLIPGNKYQLIVSTFVDGNITYDPSAVIRSIPGPPTEDFFSTPVSTTNFTVPVGLGSNGVVPPTVQNYQNGQLLNGLLINWATNPQYLSLDEPNSSFKIYSGALVANVTGTQYLDENAVVGVSKQYQVVAAVNGVDAQYVINQIPSRTTAAVRVALPNNVTGLRVTSRTINSINLSWNAATGNTGLSSDELRYRYSLVDASGNVDVSGVTTNTSINVTGLDNGGVYTISVASGINNPIVAGGNGLNYFNTQGVPSITQALYDQPPQSEIEEIYPSAYIAGSSGALLVNIVNATATSGLTFAYYNFQLAIDSSFINIVSNTNNTSSEFYITGLNNGQLYYGRSINVYQDNNNQLVSSPVSATQTGTPSPSPNQPSNLEGFTDISQNAVKLAWDYPLTGVQPNLYSVQIGRNPNDLINDLNFVDISNFPTQTIDGVLKYTTIIYDLSAGVPYYVQVIAANQNVSTSVFSVSQPSSVIEVIPYNQPSVPQQFTARPTQTTIILEWQPPAQTGGAGVSPNGQLLYQLELTSGFDTSFNNIPPGYNVSGISNLTYTFTGLVPDQTYNVRVRAYFDVQGSGFLSQGPYATLTGIITQNLPVSPVLSANASNTLGAGDTQDGRTVILNWSISSGFLSSSLLYRKIMNPAGTVTINDYTLIAGPIDSSNISTNSFTDTGSADPSNSYLNFLDGNQMFYRIVTTYTVPGSSPVTYTADANLNIQGVGTSVIPFEQPIATDSSGNLLDLRDASGVSGMITILDLSSNGTFTQFRVNINKSGFNLTSLVAVGLTPNGTQAPVAVLSQTQLNSIVYSNPAVPLTPGSATALGIAANQYGSYTFNTGEVRINTALIIQTNDGGSLVFRTPATGGAFGNNTNPVI